MRPVFLWATSSGTIKMRHMDNSQIYLVAPDVDGDVTAIAYDPVEEIVYWADTGDPPLARKHIHQAEGKYQRFVLWYNASAKGSCCPTTSGIEGLSATTLYSR